MTEPGSSLLGLPCIPIVHNIHMNTSKVHTRKHGSHRNTKNMVAQKLFLIHFQVDTSTVEERACGLPCDRRCHYMIREHAPTNSATGCKTVMQVPSLCACGNHILSQGEASPDPVQQEGTPGVVGHTVWGPPGSATGSSTPRRASLRALSSGK